MTFRGRLLDLSDITVWGKKNPTDAVSQLLRTCNIQAAVLTL